MALQPDTRQALLRTNADKHTPPILRLPPELTSAIARKFQTRLTSHGDEQLSDNFRTLAALCRTCVQFYQRVTPLLYHSFIPSSAQPCSINDDPSTVSMIRFQRSLVQRPLLASFVRVMVLRLASHDDTRFRQLSDQALGPFSSTEQVTIRVPGEDAVVGSILRQVRHVHEMSCECICTSTNDRLEPFSHTLAAYKTLPLRKLSISGNRRLLSLIEICNFSSLVDLEITGGADLCVGISGIGNTSIKSLHLHNCTMPMHAIAKLITSSIRLEHFELRYHGDGSISGLPAGSGDKWCRVIEALSTHRDHLRTLKLSASGSLIASEEKYLGDNETWIDLTTGSLREFSSLETLSVPKLAIIGPDYWRRKGGKLNTAPDMPNLLDRLPRGLRALSMHGCSNLDIDQLRELISGPHMKALVRIDVEPMCQSDIWNDCPKHDHLFAGTRDYHLKPLKEAFIEAGICWVPEGESDNKALLPADFYDELNAFERTIESDSDDEDESLNYWPPNDDDNDDGSDEEYYDEDDEDYESSDGEYAWVAV